MGRLRNARLPRQLRHFMEGKVGEGGLYPTPCSAPDHSAGLGVGRLTLGSWHRYHDEVVPKHSDTGVPQE